MTTTETLESPEAELGTSPRDGRVASRRSFRLDSGAWMSIGVGLVAVGLTLGPILYLILGGFKTQNQLATDPSGLPNPFVLQNYLDILSEGIFWRQLLNSTLVAVLTTIGVVIFGTMAAYPLARYQFAGRNLIFIIFTTGLMFPLTVAILPLYLLLREFGLVGSLWGLVVPQVAFGIALTVIIMRPFLASIPKELEEAAFVDGISRVGFFWRILLPLARPGMVTVGVLAFIGSWNAYLLPLLMLTGDASNMTLPLGVTVFQGRYASSTTLIMAYTALAMIPALVFFLMLERRIVDGLTGAVKG